jgi:hypothetical protein
MERLKINTKTLSPQAVTWSIFEPGDTVRVFQCCHHAYQLSWENCAFCLSCVQLKASRRERCLCSASHAVSLYEQQTTAPLEILHYQSLRVNGFQYLITCSGKVGRKTERWNDIVFNFDLQCFNGLTLKMHLRQKKKYVQKLRPNLNNCFILPDHNGIWLLNTFLREQQAATVIVNGLRGWG